MSTCSWNRVTPAKKAADWRFLKTHNVLLLCGDNLPDFDMLYDNHPRKKTGLLLRKSFRKSWKQVYCTAYPSYGDFEGAYSSLIISLPLLKKTLLSG